VDLSPLIRRIEALEKQKRRVMLVDGSTGDVIDDESYAADEPILLDVQQLTKWLNIDTLKKTKWFRRATRSTAAGMRGVTIQFGNQSTHLMRAALPLTHNTHRIGSIGDHARTGHQWHRHHTNMTDELSPTPVIGDGVITLPGEATMASDVPENVSQQMMVESAGNIQASNRNSRGVFDAVMGAIGATVQTNLAEVGVLEGRAVSGVNATPIAGPTTQAGP
jgi:hypothetical protein